MSSSIPKVPNFDLIVCSQELKKEIKARIDKLEISLFRLCDQLDLKYEFVKRWMNMTDPVNANQRMKQWQVIKLADSLGISIRITVVKRPIETAYAETYDPTKTDYAQ